ncbi:hypothetical protein SDRG_11278 [Saprolegnia diclina VS20]|uniref:Uncharacterized protein n=1 Tax=Saprolegnia diclina (strain VS20) TaxID=1156394 RepID=T0RFM5_SAPDV|nr:hypothetical protein SDRG_11278 [Saprolegnia diclina VS20]EQC31093.1 hypothetical protein SDRG_11278 [Saprolegnia diclina VS20]|eukprot:XP_008615532.1 hypothetical protein SDRG_11278 [Saprolegnia diclina VS20]
MMTSILHGYKRSVATYKQKGQMKMTEVKEPLSMDDPLLSKMAHAFLVFCWNLATRAASRATIMYEHITS